LAGLTVCLSHDVDRTRKTFQYITQDLKKMRLRKFGNMLNGSRPYWQFDRILEIEESYGVRSTFFFLHETMPFEFFNPSNWKLSLGRYSLYEPDIKSVIRELDTGGWEIGLHGSYNSFRDIELLKQEKAVLEDVLGKEVIGIRQHYLNLDIPHTWQLQSEAGFSYDASFGVKNDIGYRDNRCQPFIDQDSGIYVIPLALMECYLFAKAQNKLEKAWDIVKNFMDAAERSNAVFTILWHQRKFNEEEFPGYAEIYKRIIEEAKSRQARFLTCEELYRNSLLKSQADSGEVLKP